MPFDTRRGRGTGGAAVPGPVSCADNDAAGRGAGGVLRHPWGPGLGCHPGHQADLDPGAAPALRRALGSGAGTTPQSRTAAAPDSGTGLAGPHASAAALPETLTP